jgi:predicted alpha/beta hydrolase family esterase
MAVVVRLATRTRITASGKRHPWRDTRLQAMPRRPTRTVPTVLIPGWEGSPAGHWQHWLGEQLAAGGREVRWPDLGDLNAPDLPAWLAGLRTALSGLPDDGYDVVAHSLGAVLWLHHVHSATDSPRAARVALVAPPSPHTSTPEIAAFFPPPLEIDVVRHSADGTVLVGGDEDPWTPEGIAVAYGRPLKMATTVIEGGGHLNTESGYGEWPAVLNWCGRDNLAFY